MMVLKIRLVNFAWFIKCKFKKTIIIFIFIFQMKNYTFCFKLIPSPDLLVSIIPFHLFLMIRTEIKYFRFLAKNKILFKKKRTQQNCEEIL